MKYLKPLKAFPGLLLFSLSLQAQTVSWENVNQHYGELPDGINIYKTTTPLDGKPNIAYYVEAPLKARTLDFATDTTRGRRLTPTEFYSRNGQPLLVVNGTFFAFEDNRNLNLVIRNGNLLAHNTPSIKGTGRDSMKYIYQMRGGLGITSSRRADIAWLFTDTAKRVAYAIQSHPMKLLGSEPDPDLEEMQTITAVNNLKLRKWKKVRTAIAGGPVIVQEGKTAIFNEQEMMFPGKGITDKHPRTAIGYTKSGKLIILVVQGRSPGVAEGVSLVQEAKLLEELGCYEALNLDGGGSSCLLVNGKETIKPSDATGQRPVPAVFMIKAN